MEGGYNSILFGALKYKMNKKEEEIKFIQKDGRYYFAGGLHILEILVNFRHKEKLSSYSDTELVKESDIPSDIGNLPKLKGYSKELFSK
jgi:hypothetical protein